MAIGAQPLASFVHAPPTVTAARLVAGAEFPVEGALQCSQRGSLAIAGPRRRRVASPAGVLVEVLVLEQVRCKAPAHPSTSARASAPSYRRQQPPDGPTRRSPRHRGPRFEGAPPTGSFVRRVRRGRGATVKSPAFSPAGDCSKVALPGSSAPPDTRSRGHGGVRKGNPRGARWATTAGAHPRPLGSAKGIPMRARVVPACCSWRP